MFSRFFTFGSFSKIIHTHAHACTQLAPPNLARAISNFSNTYSPIVLRVKFTKPRTEKYTTCHVQIVCKLEITTLRSPL